MFKTKSLLILTILVSSFLIKPRLVDATLTSFSFDDFASTSKTAGSSFILTITAKDENNNIETTFLDNAQLSDTTGTIYPTQTADFIDGVWTGTVYITEADTTSVTVSYGGVVDTSSSFTVNPNSAIKFLTITGGNNQTGTVFTQLPSALTLKVVDPYNNPIPTIGVNFAISSYPTNATGQTLSAASGVSNSSGNVSTLLTLGKKTGTYIVSGNLTSGITNTAHFYATATADVMLSMSLTPSLGVVTAGAILPFTAKGYDKYLNEKTIPTVTWDVQNGGGTIDTTGVFTAGDTLGTYLNTVTADYGTVGTTATVTIVGEGGGGSGNEAGSSGAGTASGSGTTSSPSPTPSSSPTPTATSSGTTGTSTGTAGTLYTVVVEPEVVTALKNAQIPIVAEALDIFGNTVSNVNFTFEVSGTLGTLTQTSTNTVLLTASESGIGTVTITAQQGDIVKVAKVVGSVGTGLNRRLVIEEIESPQRVGEPFTISIAAKDSLNNYLTDYTGPIVLADTTGTIDPELVQPSDDGLWYVQAIISLGHDQVTVTAAGDGMVGVSNIFEVEGEPRLVDIPPFGMGAGAGTGSGDSLGGVLGASISGKLKELLQDKDLNKFTIARFVGAGLAAGIGILGASIGGGIMASRGLEAYGRNPFAKGKLKFNLYLSIIAFIFAAGMAVFASFLILS